MTKDENDKEVPLEPMKSFSIQQQSLASHTKEILTLSSRFFSPLLSICRVGCGGRVFLVPKNFQIARHEIVFL
jgi:hypothetical protein